MKLVAQTTLLILTSVLSCASLADELPARIDALVPAPVAISNEGALPVTCHAEIAHWFSVDLAIIAPGANAELDLWFDPASRAYATPNAGREALPVERAWCGLEGQAYVTRWQIPLDRDPEQGATSRLACLSQDDRLVCR